MTALLTEKRFEEHISEWQSPPIPCTKIPADALLAHRHWMTEFPRRGWRIIEPTSPKLEDMLIPKSFERGPEYYSRVNLRLLLGLSPKYKEDPEAIKALSGSISWITNKKIDVTEIIRNMRDHNE